MSEIKATNFNHPELPNADLEVELALDADVDGFIVSRSRATDAETHGEHEVLDELRQRKLVTSPTDGVLDFAPAAQPVIAKAREIFAKARELGAFGPKSVTLIVNRK